MHQFCIWKPYRIGRHDSIISIKKGITAPAYNGCVFPYKRAHGYKWHPPGYNRVSADGHIKQDAGAWDAGAYQTERKSPCPVVTTKQGERSDIV